jgi:UDP-N-acetylmuramyl pentapeptide phosphotransferase/UDP-N-acetylglucosamine-1-phosphate transferase
VTSLFFVPLFYVWLDDLNVWRQRVKLHSRGGKPEAGGHAPLRADAR